MVLTSCVQAKKTQNPEIILKEIIFKSFVSMTSEYNSGYKEYWEKIEFMGKVSFLYFKVCLILKLIRSNNCQKNIHEPSSLSLPFFIFVSFHLVAYIGM